MRSPGRAGPRVGAAVAPIVRSSSSGRDTRGFYFQVAVDYTVQSGGRARRSGVPR